MLHQFLIRCIEFSLRDFVPNRFAGTHGRGGNSIFAFVFLLLPRRITDLRYQSSRQSEKHNER